jgi:prevent-host-death family protein
MLTFNIHEAKTHVSRLLDRAGKGEPFIIAKAGKPLVKVVPLETPEGSPASPARFMAGQIAVPDDFDRMGEGQWRNPQTGHIARDPTKILLVADKRTPDLVRSLSTVIDAYETQFRQQSVGLTTRDSCAVF